MSGMAKKAVDTKFGIPKLFDFDLFF